VRRHSKIIGFISLKDICPIKRSAEIGELAIIKKYQKPHKDAIFKASFAYEVAGTIAIYAFEVLNLHKLYAYTFGNNPAVDNIYKAGNWVIEGKSRDYVCRNGKWIDQISWGLLKKEYDECINYTKLKEFINWK
jgi:diamine N-acetyltransferase